MSYTCENCGSALGFVTSSDGKYCVECYDAYLNILKKQNKSFIIKAFLIFLLPEIITIIALYGMSITENFSRNTHQVATYIFYATLVVGLICGSHLMRNFKDYVGEPELIVTKTTYDYDSIGPITRKSKSREFSFSQVLSMIWNVLMTFVGAAIIYVAGWLLFIIALVLHNKQIIAFRKSIKKLTKCFDLRIKTIRENIATNVLKVVNVRIHDKEYPYLPCGAIIDDVSGTEIIFGILKLNDGTAYPFPIIYYKKIGVAMPPFGVYECLFTETVTAEMIKAAFDAVPGYYESMQEHWTDECNKVLGVEFYPADVK